MTTVGIVGAGVGGLAAAIRLATAGHEVCVFERRDRAGGKLDAKTSEGFTWETGPSLLTLPDVFAELFATAGVALADRVDLVRLDPMFRHRFADGSSFDSHASAEDTEAAIEAFAPGSGAAWRRFHDHGRKVWSVAERTFFVGPMSSPVGLARRLARPRDLLDIDAMVSMQRRAESFFDDPRLLQFVGRYATYSGSSPFAAPATLTCIPAIEQLHGAWYVMGGLGALRDAIVDLAVEVGVDVRLDTPVRRVLDRSGRATGVETGGDDERERLDFDAVIANVDARVLGADLLDDPRVTERYARAEPSTSGHVLLLGVAGDTPGLVHHNVVFSADYAAEFAAMFEHNEPATDPTIYIACSSVTDAKQAPAGHENWFVLTNAPTTDRPMSGYGDHVLDVLAARGLDLSGRIVVRDEFGPAEIAERFNSPGGSIYGTSSNGPKAAFARPGNVGPRRGLFLAGGSSHPGGGLPLVAISGRIAADLVHADLTASRAR